MGDFLPFYRVCTTAVGPTMEGVGLEQLGAKFAQAVPIDGADESPAGRIGDSIIARCPRASAITRTMRVR
jgi:hypothetical protein